MNLSNLTDFIFAHARYWFKAKIVLAIICLFLLFFAAGIFHPSVLFLRPDLELTYVEQMRSLICLKKYGTCSMRYELVLGNTGKVDLDKVGITVNGLPDSMTLWEKHITPLTALNHKAYGAEFGEVNNGNEKQLDIKIFKAGTVIELIYSDNQLPLDKAILLQGKTGFVSITTDAHIINSDPRLTVVGRMVEANM